MKRLILQIAYGILVLGLMSGSLVLFFYNKFFRDVYVTSEYSKYCYRKGDESHLMKKKIYYNSLQSCGKPLK